jgi:molybdopterin molybdotransferase
MIEVAEAEALIHAHMGKLPARREALADCVGRVLAEDVLAERDQPPFDRVTMDGIAISYGDFAAGVRGFEVIGTQAAGAAPLALVRAAQCVEVMTGAMLPQGADTVIPVERVARSGTRAEVDARAVVAAKQFVHRRGSDQQSGAVVLRAGSRIGPPEMAVLATAVRGTVTVAALPRVAVISTGDELVEPGTVPGFGQVVDSNSLMVTAALQELGVEAHQVRRVRDDTETFATTLAQEAARCDAIITTGGVSMGAYDTVKEVLAAGGEVTFDQVAMQPGKPQGFGLFGSQRCPVFTLPGNPVSTLVSFEVFVAPALRQMAGRPGGVATVEAVTEHEWKAPEGKVQFARVTLRHSGDGWSAALAGGQGSYVLGGLAAADALAVIPADVTRVHAGDRVQCRVLGDLEER